MEIETVSQELADRTVDVAARWLRAADRLLTPEEKKQLKLIRRLLDHPMDTVILAKLFDRAFRSENPARVADQLTYLLKTDGPPESFSPMQRWLVFLFRGIGRYLPAVSVPGVIKRLHHYSRHIILPGEAEPLRIHLEKRRREGARVNLNHLGEAVHGEEEAERRFQRYLQYLRDPQVDCISVKISTLFSQIHPLAFDHCVELLSERLGGLYRAAIENGYEHPDGSGGHKIVNLDMEAYSDLSVTVETFRRTLAREEFRKFSAGIALQAYLPDSHACQRDLTRWVRGRVADGGAPIRIRIVKGANLEMEQIEAVLNDWPLAPYDTKRDVDASYRRMVLYGLRPENARAVRLGIASHNLFELAFAHEVARLNGTTAFMEFELLEGMSNHVYRALLKSGHPVLLYAPVAEDREFVNTVAYLIRRLSENTGEENYLRHAPSLSAGSDAWRMLEDAFKTSCRQVPNLSDRPHRVQDRTGESAPDAPEKLEAVEFVNEAPTDWSLASNRRWAEEIRRRWMKRSGDPAVRISIVAAGREISADRVIREIIDPNQLPRRVCVARYPLSEPEDVRAALAAARRDPDGWRRMRPDERRAVLNKVAAGLRRSRGDLIGAAAAETGKVFSEADAEVSEAVDFAEYYPFSMRSFEERDHLRLQGRGVGVVVSPWNFPIAIPSGGILAALAAGNTVILKPATDAVLTAWVLCRTFWDAGVSGSTLQFLPGSGEEIGMALAGNPDVDFMILTGGTHTALRILRHRPDLFLAAETGGKNATIVTAASDRDQAVGNVIRSAFGHCGQKCSATSLLILEEEVFEDTNFRRALVDAAASLKVGSAWEFQTRMGPLIRAPEGVLLRGLTRLEPGETWALEPQPDKDNPRLWSPGIKWDVQPGGFTHYTELFGPVLGVMRAETLAHAVSLANQTGYGLTSGIESLDFREIREWKAGIRAGNLYINRVTTGAVTRRQPFGGMGKSAVGPALKAGGPDYVTQFLAVSDRTPPPMAPIDGDHPLLSLAQRWRRKCRSNQMSPWGRDIEKTVWAIHSYLHWWQRIFSTTRDFFNLRGQDNLFRYQPLGRVLVCVDPRDSLFEVLARVAAARVAGCGVSLNLPPDMDNPVVRFLEGPEGKHMLDNVELLRLGSRGIIERLPGVTRLRYAGAEKVPPEIYSAASEAGCHISREPVLMYGRIELLHYLVSQSICENYHRYGNLGERGLTRSPL